MKNSNKDKRDASLYDLIVNYRNKGFTAKNAYELASVIHYLSIERVRAIYFRVKKERKLS